MSSAHMVQFTVMPDRKLNWKALGISFTLQAAVVTALAVFGIIHPEELLPVRHYQVISLVAPPPVSEYKPPKQQIAQAPLPVAKPVLAQMEVKSVRPAVRAAMAEVAPPKPQFDAPKLSPALFARSGGPKLAPQVKTGSFAGAGSSAEPTLKHVVAKDVQTGGFGDPSGIPGEGKPGARLVMAKLGSYDLPEGGGYGNGNGGSRGARGTIASAGFGNGTAVSSGDGSGRAGRGSIQQGGFGDSRPIAEAAKTSKMTVSPATTPVEILSKPNPIYTDEARQLRIEGEVLLKVLFSASGHVEVLQTVRGLGHGLDEAAARAAERIRFRPAQQDGQPVDSAAILHVVFQLAN